MVLTVNGERRDVSAATIPAMLAELGYEAEFLAVAVNAELVPKRRWAEAVLCEDDAIEIVTPRQGG